jgi:predicted phosphodiesterase
MKIQLLSDLHLEFAPIDLIGGETLLLAGDITVADTLRGDRTDKQGIEVRLNTKEFFDQAAAKYQRVYYIAGNHESYQGGYDRTHSLLRTMVSQYPNITFLQNETVDLTPTVRLFGSTGWTDLNKGDIGAKDCARIGMNDFAGAIRASAAHRRPLFSPEDSINEHMLMLQKLSAELDAHPDKSYLVMTHHCPTFKSVHPKYRNDLLNYAFASEDDGFIMNHPNIKWWVHGHTHDSFDYMVGDCRVMCNPRGYTNVNSYRRGSPPENDNFNPNFTFEVQ